MPSSRSLCEKVAIFTVIRHLKEIYEFKYLMQFTNKNKQSFNFMYYLFIDYIIHQDCMRRSINVISDTLSYLI